MSDPDRTVLIIESRDEGRAVGYCEFVINWRHRNARIPVTIGELDVQGRGYGTDALRTAVRHAFEELGLNRLWGIAAVTNPRSLSVYEKVGYKREGVARQSYMWHGRLLDQVHLGFLREDYEAEQNARDRE